MVGSTLSPVPHCLNLHVSGVEAGVRVHRTVRLQGGSTAALGANLKPFPSYLKEGSPLDSPDPPSLIPGTPTHPICIFPLASRVLTICKTVSLGQRSRFFSTLGSAVTICGASMSHTRTLRSHRSDALSCRWGPPCRDSRSTLNR